MVPTRRRKGTLLHVAARHVDASTAGNPRAVGLRIRGVTIDDRLHVQHPIGTPVRLAAAVGLVIGGLVHLQLYLDGYRDYPNAALGRSFVVQVLVSLGIAAALVVRADWWVRAAGALVAAGTLVAFAISRTDRGIFGFAERGLQPSPQAAVALAAEIGALVLLAATFVPQVGAGSVVPPRVGAGVAAGMAVLGLSAGLLWNREPQPPVAATVPTTASAGATTAPAVTPVPTAPQSAAPLPTTVPPATSVPTATPAGPAATSTTMPTAPAPAPTTAGPQPAARTAVGIVDFAFVPATIEVAAGSTVDWSNQDSFDHSVVADDGSFASDPMGNGDGFSFAFDVAGTYAYICGIHPSMAGTVVIIG